MTNSSSLSKAKWLSVAAAVLGVGAAVLATTRAEPAPVEVALAALLAACAMGAAVYARRASCAIRDCSRAITKIAAGDFDTRLVGIKETGELATLATGLNRIVDLTDAFLREVEHSMEFVSNGRYFRKVIDRGLPTLYRRSGEALNKVTRATEARVGRFLTHTDAFEGNVDGIVKRLLIDAGRLRDAAAVLLGEAEKTSTRSADNATAVGSATSNVQAIASAAEQLAASFCEISRLVDLSYAKTSHAAQEATETNSLMCGLNQTAESVSGVVSLINQIAAQTNLLALNATIEAARAGEAGRGFAVVAGEVKLLAQQTARATEDVAQQIGAMRSATSRAVDAVQKIGAVVQEASDIAGSITLGIEQQLQATREIAQNIHQAAVSTGEVTSNTRVVSDAAEAVKEAAAEVLQTAGGFVVASGDIETHVTAFLKVVREK